MFQKALKSKLKDVLQALCSDHRCCVVGAMRASLGDDPLVVVDVGSAGGPSPRWRDLEKYIHFVTFEPGKGSGEYKTSGRVTNYSVCLSEKKQAAPLYISVFSPTTSLYKHNKPLIDMFLMNKFYGTKSIQTVSLDKLDGILSESSLHPHFLKVDAEGADLDVIKGATTALDTSLLGVQIEASFIERYCGEPAFREVDAYLHERGFDFFDICCERWFRTNGASGAGTRAQIVWGNAVYFVKQEVLMRRLAGLQDATSREALLIKFISILLAYRAHDYAIECVQKAREAALVSEAVALDLTLAVKKSLVNYGLLITRLLCTSLVLLPAYLISLPVSGLRARVGAVIKPVAGKLFYHLSALTHTNARDGYTSEPECSL